MLMLEIGIDPFQVKNILGELNVSDSEEEDPSKALNC